MADQKISQLSDGGASQAADEYVVARSGSNFRIDGASVAAAATSVGTLTSLTVSGAITGATSTNTINGLVINSGGLGGATGIKFGIGAAFSSGQAEAYTTSTTPMGIGTVGAQPLRFYTNSALVAAFDSSGNLAVDTNTLYVDAANNRVGIGTASPTTQLHVETNSTTAATNIRVVGGSSNTSTVGLAPGANITLKNLNTTNNTYNGIYGADAGDNVTSGIVFQNNNDANNEGSIAFLTRPSGGSITEQMVLNSSGNLGLGVTPSAWGSIFKAMQLGSGIGTTFIGGRTDTSNSGFFGVNLFYNGTNWVRVGASNATRYYQADGLHIWDTSASSTAGSTISFTQAMTLDASGNLGVGTTSPAVRLHLKGANNEILRLQSSDATTGSLYFAYYDSADSEKAYIGYGSNATDEFSFVQRENAAMVFFTNATERARITAGGDFAVGTTSASNAGCWLNSTGQINGTVASVSTASFQAWNQATSGDNKFVEFYTEGGSGTLRGSITYNRTGGVVAYNTTSDYRAKDILGPIENAGETIDALQVYMGQMHGATIARPMLIAHEAQTVTPYAVTGEKDAVREESYEVTPAKKDEDGNVIVEAVMGVREVPVYQQMDHSVYVPLLIAEIQSLRARVAALEA